VEIEEKERRKKKEDQLERTDRNQSDTRRDFFSLNFGINSPAQ
jgi:hypothetical protein